jgi:hypothetical protein
MRTTLPALILLLTGCTTSITSPIDPDRLLHMAGEEAAAITAPKERLTRQLNIANRQTDNNRPADAKSTLRAARDTLEHSDKTVLTDHERLAGWISISELSRNVLDVPFANAALDQALIALNNVNPHQDRCPYVLGVERELKTLRGDREAAKLLVTAADWAAELPDQPTRRSAYAAFAEELFRCNDYEAARALLRRDADPAWRADTLAMMSDRARAQQGISFGSGATFAARSAPAESAATLEVEVGVRSFSKPLDFRSNYYRGK